jgi:hypothetical protein
MTQAMKDILQVELVELYVKTIEPSDITELGSPRYIHRDIKVLTVLNYV